jgi:hypothetical protein
MISHLTNMIRSLPVANGMQHGHHAARVRNRLPEPHDRLFRSPSAIVGSGGVGGETVRLVGGRRGEDEQQGVGGARDHGEQGGLVDGEDVVHGERGADAEAAEEGGDCFGVGFEGDEGFRFGGGGGGGSWFGHFGG